MSTRKRIRETKPKTKTFTGYVYSALLVTNLLMSPDLVVAGPAGGAKLNATEVAQRVADVARLAYTVTATMLNYIGSLMRMHQHCRPQ